MNLKIVNDPDRKRNLDNKIMGLENKLRRAVSKLGKSGSDRERSKMMKYNHLLLELYKLRGDVN